MNYHLPRPSDVARRAGWKYTTARKRLAGGMTVSQLAELARIYELSPMQLAAWVEQIAGPRVPMQRVETRRGSPRRSG
uniref:Uncharacterized protein n=1 Tax=viral metagenome TaxID=1070528 RepID=A0A6M3XMA0_9ZZZZ